MVSANSKAANNDNLHLEIAKQKLKLEGKSGLTEYQQKLLEWSENVDKRYAWVILFSLFVCMCSLLGPYRIYGLIFAKVTADGIYSREDASWPVSMIFTAENLIGPMVSVTTYYLSIRLTLFIGGILVTLGNLAAYFSDNLWIDVIFLGFIQGIGYAFVFMPFMEVINSYFLRYRNIALGLALSGGTISIFLWAPIAQYILDNYPWRTAYLGVTLICSLLLMMAPLIKPNPKPNFQDFVYASAAAGTRVSNLIADQSRSSFRRLSKRALSYRNSVGVQTTMLITRKTSIDPKSGLLRQESVISMNPFASTAGYERRISRTLAESMQEAVANGSTATTLTTIQQNQDKSDKASNQSEKVPANNMHQEDQASANHATILRTNPNSSPNASNLRQLMKQASIYSMDTHLVVDCSDTPIQTATTCLETSVIPEHEFASTNDLYLQSLKPAGLPNSISSASISQLPNCHAANNLVNQQQLQPETVSIISDLCSEIGTIHEVQAEEFDTKIIWDILRKPAFHFIWFNELLYFWIFSIYCLVLADLGRDRGCSKDEADHLLSFQSIGELIGRLVLTILVDLHYLSNKNVTILLLMLICGSLILVTQVTGFACMALITTAISSFISLLYIMLNGLLVDYLGERQVTLGYGMASCISGILMYFRPQAVGLFRDQLGSYDWLLISLGISCALAALCWTIEPLLSRCLGGSSTAAQDDNEAGEASEEAQNDASGNNTYKRSNEHSA